MFANLCIQPQPKNRQPHSHPLTHIQLFTYPLLAHVPSYFQHSFTRSTYFVNTHIVVRQGVDAFPPTSFWEVKSRSDNICPVEPGRHSVPETEGEKSAKAQIIFHEEEY